MVISRNEQQKRSVLVNNHRFIENSYPISEQRAKLHRREYAYKLVNKRIPIPTLQQPQVDLFLSSPVDYFKLCVLRVFNCNYEPNAVKNNETLIDPLRIQIVDRIIV